LKNPEVMDIFESGTGVPIREGYGQTETVSVCYDGKILPIFEIR